MNRLICKNIEKHKFYLWLASNEIKLIVNLVKEIYLFLIPDSERMNEFPAWLVRSQVICAAELMAWSHLVLQYVSVLTRQVQLTYQQVRYYVTE